MATEFIIGAAAFVSPSPAPSIRCLVFFNFCACSFFFSPHPSVYSCFPFLSPLFPLAFSTTLISFYLLSLHQAYDGLFCSPLFISAVNQCESVTSLVIFKMMMSLQFHYAGIFLESPYCTYLNVQSLFL